MSSRTRGALGLTWPDAGMAVKTMRVTGASWLLGAPSCHLTVSHAIRSLTCPIESELRDPIGVRTLLSHLRHRHHRDLMRRSEEHTSELQSRGHLVCRLLLEKKKQRQNRDELQTRERP